MDNRELNKEKVKPMPIFILPPEDDNSEFGDQMIN